LANELIAVIELKEKQVGVVADLIPQLYKAHLLDRETMVKTFQNLMDGYDELTIDVPQAPGYIARLLIQAGIGLSDIAGLPSSLQQALSRL
jgi:translation initiation factor 4G